MVVTAGGKTLIEEVPASSRTPGSTGCSSLGTSAFARRPAGRLRRDKRDSGSSPTHRGCGNCRSPGRKAIVGHGSNDAGAHDASDPAFRVSPGIARRTPRHADAAGVAGPVQPHRDGDLRSGHPPHVHRRQVHRRWPTACSTTTTSAPPARAGRRARARWRSSCISSARSRWSSACGPSCWRPPSLPWHGFGHGRRVLQPHGHLHRTDLRRRHHGARLDRGRSWCSRSRRCGAWRASGGRRRRRGGSPFSRSARCSGSFITEPAAMTICALLLGRQILRAQARPRLKYATLGLLFVNVSIGGTLTHFAAPPVLMVARPWGWDTAFMVSHFGWRAVAGHRRLEHRLLRGVPEASWPRLPTRRQPRRRTTTGDGGRARRRRFRPGSPSCTACSWRGRS